MLEKNKVFNNLIREFCKRGDVSFMLIIGYIYIEAAISYLYFFFHGKLFF